MPGIDYTLGMKTSGFNSGVSGALGQLASLGTKVAAITATAGLAAGAGFGVLIAKSIGKAADMETLKTAFIPLLGGIKQAQDRMAELARFAAATPFELPEIVAASKTLETLTRGAMSTGKGLTLVGDVASGTGARFEEVAVTIGRLYDGLDSGRPVGEALMRLQELGAVSGDVRGKIEALQKEGKKGKEVWSVAEQALGRFSGSMKLQSGTWNGLMSTFQDTVSAVMVTFGQPIMDALKPYLEGATAKLESFAGVATAVGAKIGAALGILQAAFEGGKLMELAGNGLKIGFMDAVNTLAKGVQAAMAGAGAALQASGIMDKFTHLAEAIGQTITSAILSALSEVPGMKSLAPGMVDSARQAKMEAGWQMSQVGKSPVNLAEGAAAAAKTFKETFASLPDLLDTTAARKDWAATLAPLTASSAAATAARDAALKATVAAVVTPQPGGPAAGAAATLSGKGSNTSADRLAQIGGYVGSAARGLSTSAAEKTEQWTRKSAEGISKLVAYSMRPTGKQEWVL